MKNTTIPAYLFVRFHERNALTFSISEMLGSAGKVIDLKLKEGYTKFYSFEVRQSTLVRYPKRVRPPCDHECKNRNDLCACLLR